jgi:PKD repeat protein
MNKLRIAILTALIIFTLGSGIGAAAKAPIAKIGTNVSIGEVPLSVQFTDLSENNNKPQWNWEFGDGNTSTAQNPTHTYFSVGLYKVNLTVYQGNTDNSTSTVINSTSAIINVSEPPVPIIPVANFTADKTEGYAPLIVQFTDTSTNSPTSWSWEFGDGQTSDVQNPEHTFVSEGVYQVNLTATSSDGSNNVKSMVITVNRVIFPGCTNPPTDPDYDDFFEDINGNGILDFDDVVKYYANVDWIQENALFTFFDYDKNSLIDFNDIVTLYAKV